MILLSVLMMYQVSAQGKRIKYNKVGRNSKTIEFKNENGTILKTLDVLGNSPYFEGFVSKKIGNLKGKSETHFVQLANETKLNYTDLIALEASIKVHLSDVGPERDIVLAGGNIGAIASKGFNGRVGIGVCKSE